MRPQCSLGFDGGEFGWLYSHRVGDARRPGRHLSEQPFRVIEPLLAGSEHPFAYRLPLRPPQPTASPEQVIAELGISSSYFVVAPGAGWPEKQWPAEKFIEAGRQLALHAGAVVVTGSAAQETLCRRVAESIPGGKVCCGRPIGQVVALLAGSSGVLCNDSAIGHLAASLGRPTVVVFTGATDPAICGPLGPGNAVEVLRDCTPVEQVISFLVPQR
jgi:ADP-heptose:LPS heptosyltransferase